MLTGCCGAAQNSQGNNREASDPPSDTLRLLQLVVPEEEDDATSKHLVPQSTQQAPPSHQSHEHGHDSRMANTDQQCEAMDGGTAPAQHSLGQGVEGDCGEVTAVANAMFNDQVVFAFSIIELETVFFSRLIMWRSMSVALNFFVTNY